MIELQTGLPGACKTQYTLWRVEELRKKTGRPVFYSGIPINPDKLPDWQPIEAAEWFTAPPESRDAFHTQAPQSLSLIHI